MNFEYDQIPLTELKNFILHEDFFIREAASRTFHQIFCQDPQVVHLTLESLDRYGWEKNITQLLNCREMRLDEQSVRWLCAKIDDISDKRTRDHVSWVIASARAPVLASCMTDVAKAVTDTSSLAKIHTKLTYIDKDPRSIWEELKQLSIKNRKKDAEDRLLDTAEAMVLALADSSFPDNDQVVETITSAEFLDEWFQIWMVDLAGERRIKEAIPDIVDIFRLDGDYHLERAMYALGKIGDPAACTLIARNFAQEQDFFRLYASSVFEMIYLPTSAASLVELTRHEEEDWIRCVMIGSILDLNSRRGFEEVIEMIREYEYDPEIAELQHSAVTHADMLGIDFPEREAWAVDRALVQERFEREMKRVSEEEILYGGHQLADVLPFRRESPKVGRNDECPCGSGKKYKKCCIDN